MSTTSKEHVLGALSETIEGIGEPLREYLSSSPDRYKNLIDVQIDKDTVFDILIDNDHLTNRTPSNQVSSITLSAKTTSTSIPDNEQTNKEISDLVESTRRYGAIASEGN